MYYCEESSYIPSFICVYVMSDMAGFEATWMGCLLSSESFCALKTPKQMDAAKSKIKLKPESIKKNMHLTITKKDGKVFEAYFKRFMFRNT